MAPTRAEAERAFDQFLAIYQAQYPKATQWLVKDRGRRLTFYDFPAEHGVPIRTTHPMERTFATLRQRSDRTTGGVRRATMRALIYQLAMSAERRGQRLRGFEHLAKVIAGVRFTDGVEELTPSEESPQGSCGVAA